MKKLILSIALGLTTMAMVTPTYAAGNDKATRHFTRQFKGASQVAWDLSEKGLIVNFVNDGHKGTSAYNKSGNWVYTIERYTASNLDEKIADIVKSSYYHYHVTGMEKVEQPGAGTIYVVHIQDERTIKTLRLANDELELVQDLIRG